MNSKEKWKNKELIFSVVHSRIHCVFKRCLDYESFPRADSAVLPESGKICGRNDGRRMKI